MPLIKYDSSIRLKGVRREVLDHCASIIAEYDQMGYSLTLRQLYYQLVARDLLPAQWADPATGSTNNVRSYKKVGDIVGDGRMAGIIDWNAIEDPLRTTKGNNHWNSPDEIIDAVAKQYMIDKWADQEYRVEVWVEKNALEDVVSRAARACDVSYLACRGYTSLSSMWKSAMSLAAYAKKGQTPVILHLGDHDPSGIDMSRDIEDRTRMFMGETGSSLIFKRIALNMDQIEKYDPPPNPAKETDSRCKGYKAEHGDESWELDALDVRVIDKLIRDEVAKHCDSHRFKKLSAREREERALLAATSENWPKIASMVNRL